MKCMKFEENFPARPPIGLPKPDQSTKEALRISLEAMDILLEIAHNVDITISERIDACRAILGK